MCESIQQELLAECYSIADTPRHQSEIKFMLLPSGKSLTKLKLARLSGEFGKRPSLKIYVAKSEPTTRKEGRNNAEALRAAEIIFPVRRI